MTRAEIERLPDEHRDGFVNRDPVALAAGHALDGTFESTATNVVRGRAAIEAVYRNWFAAFPDLMLHWDSQLIDEPSSRAMFFWTLTGTHRGPFFGIEGSGIRVSTEGAADVRFVDGAILSIRHVFDFTGLLVAAGVLKARPA
jgi:predicted ester cyclase